MRRLLNDFGSIVLALVLAVIVWIVAMNEKNPITRGTWPDPIPLELVNQPSGSVIVGEVPKTVEVDLRAPQSSWQDLRRESFRAVADLAQAGMGMNQVPVQVECSDKQVEILEVRPSSIAVRLDAFKEVEMPVTVLVLDAPPFGFEVKTDEISVTPATVTISGPESLVNQVSEVLVEAYVRDAQETLERRAIPQARDQFGESVNVTIEPNTVVVTIPIVQRQGFRNVPIRVIWQGQPAVGYRITNVSVDPSIVTIIGDPETLKALPGYLETAPIDVSDATSDIKARVALEVPENISILGVQSVEVAIAIKPIESSLTVERKVIIQGLPINLQAKVSPDVVNVILSGPLPLLDALRPDDVQVIVDLFNLAPGTHQLVPIVVVPEGIQVQSVVPERLQAEVSPLPTATPTPARSSSLIEAPTFTAASAPERPTPTPANLPQAEDWRRGTERHDERMSEKR